MILFKFEESQLVEDELGWTRRKLSNLNSQQNLIADLYQKLEDCYIERKFFVLDLNVTAKLIHDCACSYKIFRIDDGVRFFSIKSKLDDWGSYSRYLEVESSSQEDMNSIMTILVLALN